MSKKVRKVTGSCWDFTMEDQEKMADDLYKLEKGDISIMSLVSGKKVPTLVNENGLTDELEDQIMKDMLSHASDSSSQDESYDENEQVIAIPYDQITRVDKIDTPKTDEGNHDKIKKEVDPTLDYQPKKENGCREFKIIRNKLMDSLNRFVIDDGIVPTAVSFNTFSVEELSAKIDADQAGAICTDIINYIITLKHPTAIYETEDFYSEYWKFARVKNDDYDRSRYFFAQGNGYVYCWLLDTASMNDINKLIFSNYSDTIENALIAYIEMAYSAGTLNQAFFINEPEYVKTLFKSDANKQKLFHQIFTSDLTTQMIEAGKAETEDDGVNPYNAIELQTSVQNTISYLVGDITEEEFLDMIDDEDDELENISDDGDDGEDDFDDLSEGMDMVSNEDTEENSDSGIDVMEPSNQDGEDLIIKVKH